MKKIYLLLITAFVTTIFSCSGVEKKTDDKEEKKTVNAPQIDLDSPTETNSNGEPMQISDAKYPKTDQKQLFIDPITLKLNDISEYEAKQMGYTVIRMTLEQSYYVNKPSIGNMSLEQYNQKIYKSYMEEDMYEAALSRRYDQNRDTSYDFLQSITRPAESKPGLPIQAHPKAWGVSPENAWKYQYVDSQKRLSEIGYEYDLHGNRRQTLNNYKLAKQ
jgi:hypothetical protein